MTQPFIYAVKAKLKCLEDGISRPDPLDNRLSEISEDVKTIINDGIKDKKFKLRAIERHSKDNFTKLKQALDKDIYCPFCWTKPLRGRQSSQIFPHLKTL